MGALVERSDRRTFACILAAQFCSLLGQEVLQFVLPLYLLDVTGSGARLTGDRMRLCALHAAVARGRGAGGPHA